MRISDWSSDVCSSDLDEQCDRQHEQGLRDAHEGARRAAEAQYGQHGGDHERNDGQTDHATLLPLKDLHFPTDGGTGGSCARSRGQNQKRTPITRLVADARAPWARAKRAVSRSEEHTSELQSLMRN